MRIFIILKIQHKNLGLKPLSSLGSFRFFTYIKLQRILFLVLPEQIRNGGLLKHNKCYETW